MLFGCEITGFCSLSLPKNRLEGEEKHSNAQQYQNPQSRRTSLSEDFKLKANLELILTERIFCWGKRLIYVLELQLFSRNAHNTPIPYCSGFLPLTWQTLQVQAHTCSPVCSHAGKGFTEMSAFSFSFFTWNCLRRNTLFFIIHAVHNNPMHAGSGGLSMIADSIFTVQNRILSKFIMLIMQFVLSHTYCTHKCAY